MTSTFIILKEEANLLDTGSINRNFAASSAFFDDMLVMSG
jgi:hypothetical protein